VYCSKFLVFPLSSFFKFIYFLCNIITRYILFFKRHIVQEQRSESVLDQYFLGNDKNYCMMIALQNFRCGCSWTFQIRPQRRTDRFLCLLLRVPDEKKLVSLKTFVSRVEDIKIKTFFDRTLKEKCTWNRYCYVRLIE
jgi:hypothetical protein